MATDVSITTPELPVPVLQYPHWRVNFRPERYEPELIPTLKDCIKTIEHCRVSLRGWDFPHLSTKQEEREHGSSFVASWANFMDEIEYWRFYQSGQFLHLHAIEEVVSKKWRKQLETGTRSHLRHLSIDWHEIKGYIDVLNFYYRIVEIVEFATRLCQKGIYKGHLSISIKLNRIKGFVLTTDWQRAWSERRQCNSECLEKTWPVHNIELLAASADVAVKIAKWFFERFAWLDPSEELLRREQQNFLKGRA